jgi:hypothetical protein
MKALKFYDKEGVGFEFYMDYEKQSIMMQLDDNDTPENVKFLEFDDGDIDDIIIAFAELKNELVILRNINNN